jgi:aquaporin Z
MHPANGGGFLPKRGGTFWLVVVAVGANIVAAISDGKIPPWNVVAAPGLIVMIVIYFMGTVNGAHLNPVVTLAFAVRRNFLWWRVSGYLIAQSSTSPRLRFLT